MNVCMNAEIIRAKSSAEPAEESFIIYGTVIKIKFI